MPFPEIRAFRQAYPGPYERNMGATILQLLELFRPFVPDGESVSHVIQLVQSPSHWSAGHAVADEIRNRTLAVVKSQDKLRSAQYGFEKLCCEAIYNASEPDDPFDSSSPFFIAGAALQLSSQLGVPAAGVVEVLQARRE